MLKRKRSREQGDTIIEVLLAMTVLATVLTICISLMNYGLSLALSSMDRTNVQALMNGQAALLRVARDRAQEGDPNWTEITTDYANTPPVTGEPNSRACIGTQATNRFYLDPEDPTPWEPKAASSVKRTGSYPTVGDGMWIEAYKIDPDGAGPLSARYDFYIKSCWSTSGSNVDQEAETVVRLYES